MPDWAGRVVQLWRQLDGKRDVWTYLGRLQPEQCEIEVIGDRFGGGCTAPRSFAPGTPSYAARSISSRFRLGSPNRAGQ